MTTPTSGTRARVHSGGRDTTPAIRELLRTEILTGALAAGSVISQAQIATNFGVSRGPVREAFRLLESEGLIDTRLNHRARVRDLSVDELEHLYSLRVVNESLALAVSVPLLSSAELDELDGLADQLARPSIATFDFERWDALHQRFHALLLAHSGSRMRDSTAAWAAHAQRYRRAYAEDGRGLPPGAAEHHDLARLCRDRDTSAAAHLLARHLARAAQSLMTQMDPAHDSVLLRAAIQQITGPNDRA